MPSGEVFDTIAGRKSGCPDEFGPFGTVWSTGTAVEHGNYEVGDFMTDSFEQEVPARREKEVREPHQAPTWDSSA
jgi:hypothetical protein